jgi:hypothetical protein
MMAALYDELAAGRGNTLSLASFVAAIVVALQLEGDLAVVKHHDDSRWLVADRRFSRSGMFGFRVAPRRGRRDGEDA